VKVLGYSCGRLVEEMRYNMENENRELENKILYVKSDFYEK